MREQKENLNIEMATQPRSHTLSWIMVCAWKGLNEPVRPPLRYLSVIEELGRDGLFGGEVI